MSGNEHNNKPALNNSRSPKENELGGSDLNIYTYENIDLFNFPGIRDYWDILLRRKWLIIMCVLISLSITLFYTLMTTPKYKATAVIEIMPGTQKITSFQKESEFDIEMPYNIQKFYETQYKLIKSRSLAGNVVDHLGLVESKLARSDDEQKDPDFFTMAKSAIIDLTPYFGFETQAEPGNPGRGLQRQNTEHVRQAAVSEFIDGIEISPERRSSLAEVSFITTDPERAAESVNALVDEYVVWMVERRHKATRSAREFLEEQIQKTKAKLENSEEQLAGFAKQVDVVSLDKDMNLVYKQLSSLNEAYADAETDRLARESLYKQVQKGNYENLPQVVNDEALQELKNHLSQLQSEYSRMSTVYGPNYPDMKQIKAQIESVKNDIRNKTNSIAESIRRDYEAALSEEEMLEDRTKEQNRRASLLNEKAIQYNILEREVETNQSIYDSLLQRYKETEIAAAVGTSPINVVDYAKVPTVPFKPSWPFNIAIGLFFGLIAGGTVAYGAEHFDNAIKDEDELKSGFPITYLGAIPFYSNNDEEVVEKMVYTNPRSIIAEAYRVVRTSLLFSAPGSSLKSILVSSSQPLEGKSTTASNLAIAVTKFNNRVVLIDADMRRPRMQGLYLGPERVTGLSSYLIDKAGIEEIVFNTEIENLDIVPAGIIPPNPAELLGSDRLPGLIEHLSQKYDYVFIDAPPLVGFADSRLISTYVDGVLLVTSVGITQKQILRDVISDLNHIGAKITGAIVNRMNPSKDKYSYYYHYYTNEKGHALKKDIRIRPPGS